MQHLKTILADSECVQICRPFLYNIMKIRSFKKHGSFDKMRKCLLAAAAALAITNLADAANVAIPSPVTSSATVTLTGAADVITSSSIKITNSATLTMTRSVDATARMFAGVTGTLVIDAGTGAGSGRAVFKNINTWAQQGTVFFMGTNGVVEMTGVDFINNSSGTVGNGVAGVFMMNGTNAKVTLNDVYFEGNFNRGNTGVGRVALGVLTITDAVFKKNYGLTGGAGALDVRTSGTLFVTRALFDNNRAFTTGGAINIVGGADSALTNVVFKDNWAAGSGGALYTSATTTITLNMTAAGGTNNYLYSGNLAGAGLTTSTTYDSVANNVAPVAVARGGGFYYATNAGILDVNIDGGVTLTVGAAAGDRNLDTFASTSTASTILKRGAGELILNSDNSYWRGVVTVDAGQLILGNSEAKLGGFITVNNGALFGGIGTIGTFSQTNALLTSLKAQAGSMIQVGLTGATAAQSLVFERTGSNSLILEDGSSIAFDLFGSSGGAGTYDQIIADNLTVGSGTITVTQLGAASSYTLISASSLTGDVSNMALIITSTLASGPRSIFSSALAKAGQDLVLNNILSNMAMTWTGSTDGQWSGANWADVLGAPTETRVASGDSVTFDSTSDNPLNRSIAISPAGAIVSGMKITGDADYTFNLQGAGITVDASTVHGTISGTTGLLEKSGTGTLTFAGTGTNVFATPADGLRLNGGALAISDGGHIGGHMKNVRFAGGASTAIHFNDNITLEGSVSGDQRRVLSAGDNSNVGLIVADGKTLVVQNAFMTGDNSAFMSVGTGNMLLLGGATPAGTGSVLFQNNKADSAGVLNVSGSATLNNVIFTSNTAAANGGAVYNSGMLSLNLNTSATYAGNDAGAGGGFLYQNGAATTNIDVAPNETLTIGLDSDTVRDSIASSDASAILNKNGAGSLILNADSSAYTAITNINAGRLLLGNAAARLGGMVNIGASGTLGGIGTLNNVTGIAGSLIRVGLDGGLSSGTLNIAGQLNLTNGTIEMDLFGANVSDRLNVGTYLGSGNSINITTFQTGTFILGDNLGGLASTGTLKIGGYVVVGGARQTGTLNNVGGALQLIALAGDNVGLVWSGSTSSNWNPTESNWTGISDGKFAAGDRVTFNDTSAVQTITVDSALSVADMTVDTAGNYIFQGHGITGDAAAVLGTTITGATGKLFKKGTGTLALNNNLSENDFKGGIDLEQGALELGAGVTVHTGTFAVKGANTTLRAGGDASLAGTVIDLQAQTLEIDTQAHALTVSGTIVGLGGFAKAGTGTLALNTASTYSGTTTLNAGGLVLGNNEALGVSKLVIGGDGAVVTLDGAGRSIANAVDLGAAANTLTIAAANSGTLSGSISGNGSLSKSGGGALSLTGSNSFSGTLAINQGIVSLKTASGLGSAKLAGSGTLALDLTPAGNFAFASSAAGGGFTGLVAVNSGKLTLDANAASILSNAATTLRAETAAIVQKASGNLSINTLAMNGGQLNIGMNGLLPDGLLTVTTLNLGTGSNKIGIDTASLLANQPNPAVSPAPNLLDQDGVTAIKLVAAANVTGGGAIVLTGTDGAAIPAPAIANITQSADVVAKASYNYTATVISNSTAAANGVYMGYGLSAVEVLAGKTLALDGSSATDKTLSANVTGTGGVSITGTVTLAAANTYTGTTTVAAGSTLKGGVANAFAQSSAINVGAGATLDLGGFAQTAQNMTGTGIVSLGTVALTLQNTADSAFAGNISGAGKIIKTGTGKLSLTGSNAMGGVDIAAGVLGIGNASALGSGAITVTGTAARLVADINNLTIVNAINLGTNGLTVDTAANNTTLDGTIGGAGILTLQGSGTMTLAGANTFSGGLKADAVRVVATRVNAIGSGIVSLSSTSTLEFRNIASGTVSNALTGGAVELNNSTLNFKGTNALTKLAVGGGSRLTAASSGALGGGNSVVTVSNNAEIIFEMPNTIAKNVIVETGGKLTFTNTGTAPMLYLSGTVAFASSSTIALGNLVSGNTLLIRASSGVVNNGVILDPGANTELLDWTIDPGGDVSVAVIQRAANPGKEIAATYDAMSAATGAVYNRLAESFLMSLVGGQAGGPRESAWIKGVGTFGDYDGYKTGVGYKSDAYGVIAGYDRKFSDKLFLGGYIGYLSTSLRTDLTDTDGTFPYAGVYGAVRQGSAYLSADFMYGVVDADLSRFEYTGYAQGSYKGTALAGSIELGTVLVVWDRGAIKPSVSMHYMDFAYHDHKESGTGSVVIDDLNDSRLESLVALQITQGFDMPWNLPAMFDMRLGWRAALKDAPLDVSGRFTANDERFVIQGDKYNRNGLTLGLGLRFGLTEKASISLSYDYEMGLEFERHIANATLRFSW